MPNQYITPDHLSRIRRHLSGRDKFIFDCLLATGYRLDDLLSAPSSALQDGALIITESKTGKVRRKVLPAELAERLAIRASLVDHLFPPLIRRGDHMSRWTFRRHFVAACHAAGLDAYGYTPHSLRKCYAVAAYRANRSLLAVQRDLNHSSITTTMLYALSDVL